MSSAAPAATAERLLASFEAYVDAANQPRCKVCALPADVLELVNEAYRRRHHFRKITHFLNQQLKIDVSVGTIQNHCRLHVS